MSNYLHDSQQQSALKRLDQGIGGWVRKWLDYKATSYGQCGRHALFLPRVLELLDISIGENLTVLEVGCGNGWALSYHHPNIHYIAVDRSDFHAVDLRRKGVEFYKVDMATTPLPINNSSVNLIILNHVIEHVANSESFILELRRVLSSPGAIYIRTPNVLRTKWKFWDDFDHLKPFTPHALEHLMRAVGFKQHFMLYSNFPAIMLDILTNGYLRKILFTFFKGKEIEARYIYSRS